MCVLLAFNVAFLLKLLSCYFEFCFPGIILKVTRIDNNQNRNRFCIAMPYDDNVDFDSVRILGFGSQNCFMLKGILFLSPNVP